MVTVTAELTTRIQSLIDELDPPDELGYWPTRVCKYELNALPLHGNWIYLWALRPDGCLLCMDHEAFSHPTEPEDDALVVYAVLTHGARIYPDLEALVPACPPGAKPCRACAAQGMVAQASGAVESCLGCNGLGWNGVSRMG
jgi:hypothetical protein